MFKYMSWPLETLSVCLDELILVIVKENSCILKKVMLLKVIPHFETKSRFYKNHILYRIKVLHSLLSR